MLTNLLELSKFAYIDGKWINIRTEEDVKFLEIDPIDHANTHYGLFLINSNKETRQLDLFKEIAMQRANQGATPTELLELITGTSTAEIKKIMNDLAKKQQERIERESQGEQEAKERLKQLEIEMLTIKNNLDIEKEIKITEGKFPFEKELELLKIEGNMLSYQGTLDTNKDNQPDILGVEKRSIERMKVMGDILTKNKELILKEKEIESKEKIEKERNKTALKNKVTGEK
ncbi:MAG: hypothetical protein HC917_10535 [Richelia sp. SM2_1_7]|nr:hypothetical protein [Richelia sp. SM2_1_7]